MQQFNATQAAIINNAVSSFFDASVSYDDARIQLTDALRKVKLSREAIRPAVAAYVCQRTPGAIFDADKQTLVNNRNHANAKVRKAYEAAKRQISRILATAESTKPVVRNHANEAKRKAYEAAKRQISRILTAADSTKPRVVHKVDAVEKLLNAFGKLSKAEQRRFMSLV